MQFFIFFVASFALFTLLYQLRWLLFIISAASLAGVIFPKYLVPYFYKLNILSAVMETSENEKTTKVRELMGIVFLVSAVFFSRYSQLIFGSAGLIFGIAVLKYSSKIQEVIGFGGRGDSVIKLIGLGFVIYSVGWMSGLTQAILMVFLGGGR